MKSGKIMPILLIIAGVLVVILIFSNLNKNKTEQNVQSQTNNTTGNVTVQNVTQTKQGEVEVANVNVTSDGNMTNVTAEVTNNDTKTYSSVEISVIFYDANNAVLSTAKGLIENLKPGDKKGFSSSISGDFSKSSKYEVKIDKVQ